MLTHVRTLMTNFSAIDAPRKPRRGVGGGSFANDARNSRLNNVKFVNKECSDAVQDGMICVLEATRDIAPGEEVFVSYGAGYWRRFSERTRK